MTSKNETGETPELVAQHATKRNVLDHLALTLLGVFGPGDDMRALVRLPGGRIQQVEVGKRLSGGRIVAIDADGVMLSKNGESSRITIPGG